MSAVCVIAEISTDFGREIRATVLQRTHLTLGVGIAQTKTPAKLANHAAKQWPRQTGGVVDLSCPQRQRKLMALLPVSEVWGIGRRIGKKLRSDGDRHGTPAGGERYPLYPQALHGVCSNERYGSCAASLAWRWRSLPPLSRKLSAAARSGIGLRPMRICARRSAAMPRGQQKSCAVSISTAGSSPPLSKTSPFAQNEPYYGNSASLKLLTPTQDSRDIIAAATSCLDAIWKAGHRYQKAGVMLGDFYSQGVAQLNLFDELAPRHNSARLMQVLDQLNAKNGRGRSILPARGSSSSGR